MLPALKEEAKKRMQATQMRGRDANGVAILSGPATPKAKEKKEAATLRQGRGEADHLGGRGEEAAGSDAIQVRRAYKRRSRRNRRHRRSRSQSALAEPSAGPGGSLRRSCRDRRCRRARPRRLSGGGGARERTEMLGPLVERLALLVFIGVHVIYT